MIKTVLYNDNGSWNDDPIFMVSDQEVMKDSISVCINRDKVFVSGIYDKEDIRKELVKLMDKLEAMSFEDRIKMLKSMYITKKFNL